MDPEERAAAGVFLAMQYPVEIPGVANMYFLRQAMNAQRRARGEAEIGAGEFMKRLRAKAKVVGVSEELLKRDLNFGFSGGEKKRNEILQMAMLEPRLGILDETDSGLDIDALRTVADGVNALRDPSRAHHRHHPLSAAARLHRARPGARAGAGPDPAQRRQGARARARGRRLCGLARRRSSPRTASGPEAMATARRAIEPVPALRRVFANVHRASCPLHDLLRLAPAHPLPASVSWASRPRGPRTGSTPTSARAANVPLAAAPRVDLGIDAIAPHLLGGPKARRLIFVNGHVVPELSHVQSLPVGVRAMSLGRGAAAGAERVADALAAARGRSGVHCAEQPPSPVPAPGSSSPTVPTPRSRCSSCSSPSASLRPS